MLSCTEAWCRCLPLWASEWPAVVGRGKSPRALSIPGCSLSSVLWFWALWACGLGSGLTSTVAEAGPPHVVLIAIDDLNDWIGPLGGHPLAHTPNIDRLARRGTVFANAHCQAPLCNPSRSSLLTGLRPGSTGIYGLAPSFRTLPALARHPTLLQSLRQAGYRTELGGKIFHQAPVPQERDAEVDLWGPGFGPGKQPAAKLIQPTPMGNHPAMDWGPFPHADADKGDYQLATWACERLKLRPADRPLLLAAGFFLPHVPCHAPPAWFARLPTDDTLLPPAATLVRGELPRFGWYLHWNLPEPRLKWLREHDQWRNLCRSYLACTTFVDAQIGRLLDAIDEQGLTDNTLVVLFSDHGFHLGEKQISGKNTLWERSTRVPLILAGPGVAAGAVCQRPVELLDVYPTLCDLCGAPAPAGLEGVSLRPWLVDANARRARPAITTHNRGNHAVRSERWRLIAYADGSEELYDHASDPHETRNLAGLPDYAEVRAEHRRWLPQINLPPAPGSAHRVLTYDPETDLATWEGTAVSRESAIPE